METAQKTFGDQGVGSRKGATAKDGGRCEGGDCVHDEEEAHRSGEAATGLVKREGRERRSAACARRIVDGDGEAEDDDMRCMEGEAGEEATTAEAVEAGGDGVAGVQEPNAGIEVCCDDGRIPLAGERGDSVTERDHKEVHEAR